MVHFYALNEPHDSRAVCRRSVDFDNQNNQNQHCANDRMTFLAPISIGLAIKRYDVKVPHHPLVSITNDFMTTTPSVFTIGKH